MKNHFETIKQWLVTPINSYVLGLFRIFFGILMTYQMVQYINIGLIRNMFVLPKINFQYDYLRWIKPLPESLMNAILYIMLACAVAMTIGFFFKWACRLFAAGYAYILLLDKSIYNNHIYLFILLALLLSFTDADRSLTFRKNSSVPATIPRWQQFILQFQIVIAYFFGGIAKTGHDWLFLCQPVKLLVENLPKTHLLAPLLKNEAGILLLNYGGFLIDFGAPFILWYKPFRKWGIIFIALFHIFNSIIFTDIGVFPFVMLGSLILFFEISELPVLRNIIGNVANQKTKKVNKAVHIAAYHFNTGTYVFLIVYFIFQILFPLRGYFLPNDMDWTTIGNRFSWRMKVDTRQINEMTFIIINPVRKDSIPVEVQTFVNDMQILNMAMDPRSVTDFAKMLKATAAERGQENTEVIARIKVSYNGREPQLFVRPDIDMTSVKYTPFNPLSWIYPVKE